MTAWRFGDSGAVSADWPYQPRTGRGGWRGPEPGSPPSPRHIDRVTSADSQAQIASPHRPTLQSVFVCD